MEHRYYYFKMNPALRGVYDRYYHALSCRAEQFDGDGLSPAQINELLHLILLDHPQLCHFEGRWGFNGRVCPVYTLSAAQENALSNVAESILQELNPNDNTSAIQSVFDWLIDHVSYDPTAPHSQSSYGALVEQRALCKGISKAFQLLLHKLRVPCILVEGTLDGQMKHVWNMVHINGQWLHVDVCMGYPMFYRLTAAPNRYSCFCVDTETIQKSHQIHHPHLLPTEVLS